jgi:hypothetical protein
VLDELDQVPEGPPEAVELGDDELVASAAPGQPKVELGPGKRVSRWPYRCR